MSKKCVKIHDRETIAALSLLEKKTGKTAEELMKEAYRDVSRFFLGKGVVTPAKR